MNISVIFPVLDTRPYLESFLEALTSQSYCGDYEIIAVDNGSTDGSLQILEAEARLTVLRESTPGAYAARNRGIRAARGQILAFIDPDCIPCPTWLAAIDCAVETPETLIVLGKREYDTPSRALRRLSDYDTTVAKHVFSSDTPEIYFGYTNNMAVRRSLFDELGPFQEIRRGADTVFVRKAVDRRGAGSVAYEPGMLVCHEEIRRVTDFYSKRAIYGTSNQQTRKLGSSRPLRLKERLQVFARTVRDFDYTMFGAVELLALLSWGVLCYEFGRWRGRWSASQDAAGGVADEDSSDS